MQVKEPIRTLYSRNHTTILPKLGVFLAGPTPPDGQMHQGWRKKVIDTLKQDERLDPGMVVVSPEPESGYWKDIDLEFDTPKLEDVMNKQIPWEWQYLTLCDITAFWLPTYWVKRITDMHGVPWHSLKQEEKDNLVADSFIEAIAQALIQNNWKY